MENDPAKRKKPVLHVSEKTYNELATLVEGDLNTIRLSDIGIDNEADKKKQIPLRISAKLYNDLAEWAEDDFRSINGQIEYLLNESVKKRKSNGDKK